MTFAGLTRGDALFVDANIFVFHFAPDPLLGASCTQLLQRIDQQELIGYTSTSILCEVAHRLTTLEARTCLGWSREKSSSDSSRTPASSRASRASAQRSKTLRAPRSRC
jgi:hypothetical protein